MMIDTYWTLDEVADAGLIRAIIITNPHKPMLEAAARNYPGPLELEFVAQDHPRRLGDALLSRGVELDDVPVLQRLAEREALAGVITAARFFDVGVPEGYRDAVAASPVQA